MITATASPVDHRHGRRHAPISKPACWPDGFDTLDLERELGLIGGDIFTALTDQLFSARPLLGHGAYRMPVEGLYICGSGAHPGGGVSGLPGRNAAREMIRDFRRRRA